MSYRVFISYSHDDRETAEAVVKVLEENGLSVLWDKNFVPGYGFQDQIKNFISYAHVFLPLITPSSSQRGWVHQEIGYAMALNIPVLPVASDILPGQMIEHLQAVPISKNEHSKLAEALSLEKFELLVNRATNPCLTTFHCAAEQEDRSAMIARYAQEIVNFGERGRVRCKGGRSPFSMPDKPIANPLWKERYDGRPRNNYQLEQLRAERLALGQHASAAGCSLILNISSDFTSFGPRARTSRLRVLRDFLLGLPEGKGLVAINNELAHGEDLLLVGDWFVATAVAGAQGIGYRQTIFSRHAPTMRRRVEEFDQELDDLLAAVGTSPAQSTRVAIAAIEEVLAGL